MDSELMGIINSLPMWSFAALLVLLVLFQSAMFFRLCKKEADAIGYPRENLKSSFKIGMITAFGPSLSNIVAMISMMAVIGSPITWMRLSIIGAAPTELGVATLTAQSQGLAFGEGGFTVGIISLIFLMMAIVGTGWLLVVITTTSSMGKIRAKFIEKDKVWFSVLTSATTIGLFSNLAAQQLAKFSVGLYAAVLTSFAVMFVLYKILGDKYPGLKKYSLTIAMVAGVIIGGLINPGGS